MKPIILSLACALALSMANAAVITVTTVNNESPGAGEVSLLQALQTVAEGDTIQFNIPGAGPHIIVTPIGGYPLITAHGVTIDGYSQPGSSPNSNPILGGNNAQIKIVLDSTGAESAPNPGFPNRPLRRSTRLDFPLLTGNTGYGDSENCILGVFEADNVIIRGLSFIARHTAGNEDDPAIYCVALVNQATNAHVNGCLFGMAPGGTSMADLRPAAAAVAAFRWRIPVDVYSEQLRFGTDGDGVNDRAEVNVALGCRIALALELPRAKVSGNYFNIFPNGLSFVDVEAIYAQLVALQADDATTEVFENGRVTDNTVFGTDGDGVSDADERNIAGHSVYSRDIEFYTSGLGAVVAGNYFGVGIDGITQGPVPTSTRPDFISMPGNASIRVGSNGDGVSDDLEANLVVNVPGSGFVAAGVSVPIVARGNTLLNNGFQGVPFGEGQNGRFFFSYYAGVVADPSVVVPVLNEITNNVLSGTFAAPTGEYIQASVDVYTVDPGPVQITNYWPAPVVHPARLLGSFVDNGAGDTDPTDNAFAFNLSAFGLSDTTHVTVTVTYSKDIGLTEVARSVTSPTAGPVSRRPVVNVRLDSEKSMIWWLGKAGLYYVQQNNTLDPDGWSTIFDSTWTGGRNISTYELIFAPETSFFRLIAQ